MAAFALVGFSWTKLDNAAATCQPQLDTDYIGGDYRSLDSPTKEACCDACSKDSRCSVAVQNDGRCYLKNETAFIFGPQSKTKCAAVLPGKAPTPIQSSWAKHRGINCYSGHGGTPVDPSDYPLESLDLEDCQAACTDYWGGAGQCVAVVRESYSTGPGDCYLRSTVALDECETGSQAEDYDTFTRALPPSPPPSPTPPTYAYEEWSAQIKNGACKGAGLVPCTVKDGIRTYAFPPGIFEIGEQLLVPENASITGAANPNDPSDPTASPDWRKMTLFLATRGATEFERSYCTAHDMVTTRVGFVLSSRVSVRNVAYQGIDTIRPDDNGALCGGGAFETKGCARNSCSDNDVNNGGSDGIGSTDVLIEHVRLNDYHHAEDRDKIGFALPDDADCNDGDGCCFCRPNGVRSSQVAVWVPATRNDEGTQRITVRHLVSRATQADGINLHGYVRDALVEDAYIESTGDDTFAVWGAMYDPENITFRDCTAINPGILRPNWYGNCVAVYGLKQTTFERITCAEPTIRPIEYGGEARTHAASPLPTLHALTTRVTSTHRCSMGGGSACIDTSMFVFYYSFSAHYPKNNAVHIDGWKFTDLDGRPYSHANGTTGDPGLSGKKGWTKIGDGKYAPFILPDGGDVNVIVADL